MAIEDDPAVQKASATRKITKEELLAKA